MPVKRRLDKRRLSPDAEEAIWRTYWCSGFDFFGDVADLTGLVEPANVWPIDSREAAQSEWTAASDDAWQRVGHLFEGERHAG